MVFGEGGEILTLDAKMKRLASSFVQVIRCGAHVLAGAAPGHALKHQALIRPDYPGRRVVRQYLVLKTATRFRDNSSRFEFYLFLIIIIVITLSLYFSLEGGGKKKGKIFLLVRAVQDFESRFSFLVTRLLSLAIN